MAEWTWKSRKYDGRWAGPLWLYGEIDLSSAVDEIYPASGEEQVEYWREYVRRCYPEMWEADAVSVSWYINGGAGRGGVFEGSPDCPTSRRWYAKEDGVPWENFSTFFTRPRNTRTGEPLRSWSDLPREYRFKEFSRVYGFVPPHAAFVPVRTWSPWTAEPLASLGPSSSCLRCGRPLSDALSIEAGHGPWCARKTLSSV